MTSSQNGKWDLGGDVTIFMVGDFKACILLMGQVLPERERLKLQQQEKENQLQFEISEKAGGEWKHIQCIYKFNFQFAWYV